jgi:5-methylcytosine-specific restriction endonuclease McrA
MFLCNSNYDLIKGGFILSKYSKQRNSRQKRELKKRLFKLYGRKNHCPCFYCGIRLNIDEATIEHLECLSQGGTWHISNLRVSCRFCNNDRGTSDWMEYKEKYETFYREENIVTLFNNKNLFNMKNTG